MEHATDDCCDLRGPQIEICLWVVITVALPAMVSDPSLAFFTEAQTGVVLAAGTLGSVVGATVHACAAQRLSLPTSVTFCSHALSLVNPSRLAIGMAR